MRREQIVAEQAYETHDITMSAPHPRGREVFCSCGKTFVAEAGTVALLAQMDHREASRTEDGCG